MFHHSTRARRATPPALLSLILTSSACVPFVVPPVQLRGGVGAAHPSPKSPEAALQTGSTLGELSLSLHPFQWTRSSYQSHFDLGLGYRVEGGLREARDSNTWTAHGPELELGYTPLRFRGVRAGVFTELSAIGMAHDYDRWNVGMRVGALLELSSFLHTPFSETTENGQVVGVAHGAGAFGIYAAAGYRALEERSYFTTTFGVAIRIPLIAGVGCCAWPSASSSSLSFSSDSDSETRTERKKRRRSKPEEPPPSAPKRRYTPARPRAAPEG